MESLNKGQVVIRYQFANVGRVLSHNFKSRTGNITITGTVVRNALLEYVRRDSSIHRVELGKAANTTGIVAFDNELVANEYMSLVNEQLETYNSVSVVIEIDSYNTIFNANQANKTLFIKNPLSVGIYKCENIVPAPLTYSSALSAGYSQVKAYSLRVNEIPSGLTAIKEARLRQQQQQEQQQSPTTPVVQALPAVQTLPVVPVVPVVSSPQVEAARNFLNVITREQLDSILADGITLDELKEYSDAELKELALLEA